MPSEKRDFRESILVWMSKLILDEILIFISTVLSFEKYLKNNIMKYGSKLLVGDSNLDYN